MLDTVPLSIWGLIGVESLHSTPMDLRIFLATGTCGTTNGRVKVDNVRAALHARGLRFPRGQFGKGVVLRGSSFRR